MTGRERFLAAIHNQKADRLPCQVHSWMEYYRKKYLNSADQYEAYEYFGMDPVIYCEPEWIYSQSDLANWDIRTTDLGTDQSGNQNWIDTIKTPSGVLTRACSRNEFTSWETEHLIKTERDFEIWQKHVPLPIEVDWRPVIEAKKKIGSRGIVRGPFFDFGQGSPWQSFSNVLRDMQASILDCFDNPEWVHYVLEHMLQKKLRVIELAGKIELDLVETGGGGGSSTVISPSMHEEFCLPYDKRQHEALHNAGTKIVYHLCGGVMPLLELVAENGTDGLETMTPPAMGGDCDLREATKRIGDKLFFIGGFDQNSGFEHGTPETVEKMVRDLFDSCPGGGYICSPSDHFFFGDPENIKAFVRAATACKY